MIVLREVRVKHPGGSVLVWCTLPRLVVNLKGKPTTRRALVVATTPQLMAAMAKALGSGSQLSRQVGGYDLFSRPRGGDHNPADTARPQSFGGAPAHACADHHVTTSQGRKDSFMGMRRASCGSMVTRSLFVQMLHSIFPRLTGLDLPVFNLKHQKGSTPPKVFGNSLAIICRYANSH